MSARHDEQIVFRPEISREGVEVKQCSNCGYEPTGMERHTPEDCITALRSRADRGQCIRVVILVTGGWSDNEQALNNIDPFIHVMYWHQSTRGGMHTFEIPKEGVT